jgi:hypothetical protein
MSRRVERYPTHHTEHVLEDVGVVCLVEGLGRLRVSGHVLKTDTQVLIRFNYTLGLSIKPMRDSQ